MIVSLIVAASDNDVIGAGGTLPWHLPEDMRRFRRLTTGHAVVLGRVTHESILARLGKPLPGRTSIVVSRSPAGGAAGRGPDRARVRWVHSPEEALGVAAGLAAGAGDEEVFVAGGVTIYAETLPYADRVYLTRVHAIVEGDRSMPAGWLDGFALARAEPADDPAAVLPYEWLDYVRGVPGAARPGGGGPGDR